MEKYELTEKERDVLLSQMAHLQLEHGRLVWRDGRKKNTSPNMAELFAHYCEAVGEVPTLNTPQIYRRYVEESLSNKQIIMMRLSQLEAEWLSEWFRFCATGAEPLIYIRSSTTSWQVKPVLSLIDGLRSVWIDGKSVFERLREEYISHAEDERLPRALSDECIIPFNNYLGQLECLLHDEPRFWLRRQPAPISSNPQEPTFFCFDTSSLTKGDCSTWLRWETSMPEELVMSWRAWVYSVYEPQNHSRQAVWLYDADGFKGKTKVCKALMDSLGEDLTVAINKDALKNQFSRSKLHGKRLVVYSDCKNASFAQSEICHQITGGDPCDIEHKGKQSYTGTIYAKLLIGSNLPPSINTSATHETSRLIFIPLHWAEDVEEFLVCENGVPVRNEMGKPIPKGNNRFGEELKEQLPAYLHLCAEAYLMLCPKHEQIDVSEEGQQHMWESCESSEYIDYQAHFERHYTLSAKGGVECEEVQSDFRTKFGSNNIDLGNFTKWLATRYGIRKRYVTNKKLGKRVYKYVGMTTRDYGEEIVELEELR